jgi:hypothetical protein
VRSRCDGLRPPLTREPLHRSGAAVWGQGWACPSCRAAPGMVVQIQLELVAVMVAAARLPAGKVFRAGCDGLELRPVRCQPVPHQFRLTEQLAKVGGPAMTLPAGNHGGRVAHHYDHTATEAVSEPSGGQQRVRVIEERPAAQQPPGQEAACVLRHPGQVVRRAVLAELGGHVVPQPKGLPERGQPAVLVVSADVLVVPRHRDRGVEHTGGAARRVVRVEGLVDVGQLAAGLEELADPAGAAPVTTTAADLVTTAGAANPVEPDVVMRGGYAHRRSYVARFQKVSRSTVRRFMSMPVVGPPT